MEIIGATQLQRTFFERDTVEVARDLLGRTLVHEVAGQRVSGRVVETEAYQGREDMASHAFRGKTARNQVMFGLAGISYIYLIYGNHSMLNVIAKPSDADYAAAVLIRALEPLEGLHFMAQQRPRRPQHEWTNGPGRLCKALGIDTSFYGVDMTSPDSPLTFEDGQPVPDMQIEVGPRVGLGRNVEEPWRSKPWRCWIAGNRYVSRGA